MSLNETIRRAFSPGPDRESGSPPLNRRWWCALALLTLVGLAVRAHGVGDYWLNPDEGIFYQVATTPADSLVEEMAGRVNPPLYYLALRFIALRSHDPVLLRSVSLTAGTVLIPVVGLLGAELGGTVSGLAAALLVSLSPGLVLLSRLVRPYMLMLAFLAAALLFLARFRRTGRARDAWGFPVFMILALGTHYSAFPELAALLPVLAVPFLLGRWKRREGAILFAASLPLLAAAGLLYLLHIGPHLVECPQRADLASGYLSPHVASGVGDLWRSFIGLSRYLFGRPSPWLLLPLTLAGIILAARGRRHFLTALVLAPLLVAAALSLLSLYPFGGSRHSAHLLVSMVLPPAFALGALSRLSRRGAALAAIPLAALLCVGLASLAPGNPETEHPSTYEFTLSAGDLKRLEPHLEGLRESPGVIVVDAQTREALHPLLEYETGPGESLDGDLTGFSWGRRRLVALDAWEISPTTLAETLGRLLNEHPERPPGDLRILQAGWSRDLTARMVPLLGQASVNDLADGIQRARGFVSFRLKPRRFLKRMERTAGFSVDPSNPLSENRTHAE